MDYENFLKGNGTVTKDLDSIRYGFLPTRSMIFKTPR